MTLKKAKEAVRWAVDQFGPPTIIALLPALLVCGVVIYEGRGLVHYLVQDRDSQVEKLEKVRDEMQDKVDAERETWIKKLDDERDDHSANITHLTSELTAEIRSSIAGRELVVEKLDEVKEAIEKGVIAQQETGVKIDRNSTSVEQNTKKLDEYIDKCK